MCDALGYAHSRGIVHRDVKPDNVHILPGGIIKLTDFGIARITAEPSITAHGQVFGTPSYMSPEQVASHTVDHRTDIFSLGITLYEMLTGRKPFAGDSVITITYNIMNIQPHMPVGVPPGLHAILQRALAKDVNLRYQNAAAMAADLRAEKFALESSSGGGKTPTMTFAPGQASSNTTLDTGTVPSEISGLPAFSTARRLISSRRRCSRRRLRRRASTPIRRIIPITTRIILLGWLNPAVRNVIGLIFSILGIAALLMLIIWGVMTMMKSNAPHASQSQPASGLYQQANAALNNGDYQTAAQNYADARRAAPNSEQARLATNGLSEIALIKGQDAEKSNNAAEAQTNYEHAIQLNSKNAAAYDNLGNLQAQRGDQAAALESWKHAITPIAQVLLRMTRCTMPAAFI